MPRIIRDLPYFDRATNVLVHGHSFPVKRDQIVLWISITEKGTRQLDERTPRLPAILDVGCNYNLLINERHLTVWAGVQTDYFRKLVPPRGRAIGDACRGQCLALY